MRLASLSDCYSSTSCPVSMRRVARAFQVGSWRPALSGNHRGLANGGYFPPQLVSLARFTSCIAGTPLSSTLRCQQHHRFATASAAPHAAYGQQRYDDQQGGRSSERKLGAGWGPRQSSDDQGSGDGYGRGSGGGGEGYGRSRGAGWGSQQPASDLRGDDSYGRGGGRSSGRGNGRGAGRGGGRGSGVSRGWQSDQFERRQPGRGPASDSHQQRRVGLRDTASLPPPQRQPAPQNLSRARPTEAGTDFLAPDATFQQLGLSEDVTGALRRAGFKWPSRVQALVMPPLVTGQDVVIAAETGSGKTLSYLAPVMSSLLQRQAVLASVAEPPAHGRGDRWRDLALVLAPNAALCRQVVAAAESLTGPDGQPLLAAFHISSATPPPYTPVDIAVTTPAALQNLLHGAWLGAEWSREGLPRRIRHLVLDEADLLLGGSFAAATLKLLEMLRLDEREVRRRQAAWQLRLSPSALAALPHQARQAASAGGLEAMLEVGYKPSTEPRPLPAAAGPVAAPVPDAAWEDSAIDSRTHTGWRRQYVFAGATMPAEGKKSVAADLRARFPGALWLAGASLHQSVGTATHAWRLVDDRSWLPSLLAAVESGGSADAGSGAGRTLVFARDVGAAEEVAGFLTESLAVSGRPVLAYHRGVPAADRDAALDTLARQEDAVVVATDAAARGLDIPHIAHVVQADFASSAVEFLHRVGRTARAGRTGAVTSLYTELSQPLAEAIRDAIQAGQPIEGAFSRNRSFRKRLRKYGEYVPAGTAG